MSDKCPKCGAMMVWFIDYERNDGSGLGLRCVQRCGGQITFADLRRQRDHTQARYDALRITSETTIGQLRQQIVHLKDRAKELEESQDDAESIMSCLAMQARFYQRDMPLTTPVLQHGNSTSTLTVAVLFLAEDWLVARMDAEKRAEWEKRADEMRSKIGKDEE